MLISLELYIEYILNYIMEDPYTSCTQESDMYLIAVCHYNAGLQHSK